MGVMHISTSAVWWFTFEAQCIHFIVHNKINWQTKINLIQFVKFKKKKKRDFYINICVFLNLLVLTVMVGESDNEYDIFENSLLL